MKWQSNNSELTTATMTISTMTRPNSHKFFLAFATGFANNSAKFQIAANFSLAVAHQNVTKFPLNPGMLRGQISQKSTSSRMCCNKHYEP